MKEDIQNPKKRKKYSDQVKEKIKLKPFSQEINNIQITYALLKKKNQKFIFTNERLLMLKGLKSIGYARTISSQTLLPFYQESHLPKLKVQIELIRIHNVLAQDQLLIIEFIPQANQPKWQFVCDSKPIANDWKKLIQDSCNAVKLNNSNLPIQVNLPENNNQQGNITPQNGFKSPQKSNGIGNQNSFQSPNNGSNQNNGSLALFDPNTSPNQMNYSTNSPKGKLHLPTIPEQHQDNETEHPFNRDSFPLGKFEEVKQLPQFLSLTVRTDDKDNTKPLDLREEYMRKKKEEEKIKDSLIETQNLLKGSNISNKSNRNDKKILDCNWDYEFVKGESQYIIVERFKAYAEDIIQTIIDQLSLEEKRRQYKPIDENLGHLKYEIGGVSIEIAFLELNEVSNFQDRSTIVSSQRVKMIQQQFKNANYILQITRNKGRFRVPLMMLSQYKGFTVLSKANIHSSTQYSNFNSIQQDINQLQRDTKISRSLFEDEENLKVIAADQKFFEKLSRSENKFKKFDVCFLTDINHFLPQDFFGFNKIGSNINRVRAEIVQDEEYDEFLFNGGNLNMVLSRVKVPTEIRDAINLLTEISKSIPERVSSLVQEVQNLDRPITNSQELSELLHLSGLNMRYLGLAYDNAKENWFKSIILAEIVARSAKYFLRYDLQDSSINLGATSIDHAREYQINQVLGWLNRILGIGPQSDSLWRQIFRQAQTNFKCTINRDNLNIGFLIQALEYHGRFKLQNITLTESFFKANNIFTKYNFASFILTSKTYDLSFTDHYSLINSKMNDLSYESYEQIRSILNLQKRESLESYYYLNSTHRKIITYLIHWLSPNEAPYLYNVNNSSMPSQYFYEVQMTAIKWELKAGRISQAEKIKDFIVEHVNKWLGECHPILADLFEIFSRYYLSFREQEKRAVSYCKNALKNQEKLLGGNHIKLADAYYNLGEIYLHYSKKVDALQSYKRASQILTQNQATNTQPFVQIALKVGQLYLANNVIIDALQSVKQAQGLAEELKNPQQYLACAELIGRCYEISQKWQDYIKFVTQLTPVIALYKDSICDLERVLKVIFMPIFHNIATKSRESCKALSTVLAEFQERNSANALGYAFIKTKIEEKVFPSVFLDYLDNIQLILKEINSSNVLSRWRGFQNIGQGRVGRSIEFLSFLQSLTCYLSGNFVEGIFAEQQ